MLMQSLLFILQTAADLLGGIFLLRFLMQWARVPFRNPIGQFVAAASDWAVMPARRIIPGLWGMDLASLLLAWLVQLTYFMLVMALSGLGDAATPALMGTVALVALLETARLFLYLIFGIIISLVSCSEGLRTEGGDLVTIPNGDIRTVTNRTRGWARINVEINIADPAQVDAAVATIDQVGRDLAADPGVGSSVIEPPHFMMVKDISEGGICLLVWGRVRAADRFAVEGEYRRRLLEALAAAGVILVTAARVNLVGPETRTARRTRAGRPT